MGESRQVAGGLLIAVFCAVALWCAEQDPAARGREVFERRCSGCHSLDVAKVGPPLRGVYGRRAAADPKFPYSDALRKAKVTWDAPTLDRWLADSGNIVADNDMSFRLDDAGERAAIVAYLRQLSPKQGDAR